MDSCREQVVRTVTLTTVAGSTGGAVQQPAQSSMPEERQPTRNRAYEEHRAH